MCLYAYVRQQIVQPITSTVVVFVRLFVTVMKPCDLYMSENNKHLAITLGLPPTATRGNLESKLSSVVLIDNWIRSWHLLSLEVSQWLCILQYFVSNVSCEICI